MTTGARGMFSTAGCILLIDDDPSSLRVGTSGTGGDAGPAAPYDPNGTVQCLPPFMNGTLAKCIPCLAARCGAEFDGCCADAACRATKRFESTPLLTAIDECQTGKCADECLGFECHSSTGICSCVSLSPLPTDEQCSVSTVPGSICCASIDWPADGSCECSLRDQCTQGLKLISHCSP